MTDTLTKPSIKDRVKVYLPHATAFAVGTATAAVAIRYRNSIAFNERIWAVPVELMRERVAPGSEYLMDTPKGEMFITKIRGK